MQQSRVQLHSQKFWFVENPGEICENLRKILENLGKLSENTGKNGAQRPKLPAPTPMLYYVNHKFFTTEPVELRITWTMN